MQSNLKRSAKNAQLKKIRDYVENELDYPYRWKDWFKYKADGPDQMKIDVGFWTITLDFDMNMFSVHTHEGCACGDTNIDFFMSVKDNMDPIAEMYYEKED